MLVDQVADLFSPIGQIRFHVPTVSGSRRRWKRLQHWDRLQVSNHKDTVTSSEGELHPNKKFVDRISLRHCLFDKISTEQTVVRDIRNSVPGHCTAIIPLKG